MNKNIGRKDRVARMLIGVVLIILSITFGSPTMAIVGAFTLYEAAAGWCAFYQLIGINTCPVTNKASGRIEFGSYLVSGLAILLAAIIMNYLIGYIGWRSWYDVLFRSTQDHSITINQISLDNWIFLLVIYPFTLSFVGVRIYLYLTR